MDSSHLSEDNVEGYSMGKLTEAEIALVEEHLLTCEQCQAEVQSMDAFLKAARDASKTMGASQPSAWDRIRGYATFYPGSAWAGASAVAAVIAILIFFPYTSRTPQHLELSTVRGAETVAPRAKANTPLDLQLDLTELPVSPLYTVELVDAGGNIIRNYTSEPKSLKLNVAVGEPLPTGQYWIRLYGNSLKTELLREYGLKVE